MFYTSSPFDRADHIRKDETATSKLWKSDKTRIVPYFKGKMLVSKPDEHQGKPVALTLTYAALPSLSANWVFLGFKDEVPYFAIDLSELEHSALPEPLPESLPESLPGSLIDGESTSYQWEDLRTVGPNMSYDDGAVLAYTRALMHWQQQTLHCNLCGSTTSSSSSGHVRVCSSPTCAKETFPRTDPAVIMLVTSRSSDGDPAKERCLLGRSSMWAAGVYSTLAGFVEPGETLESAVSREVYEEAGIHTTNVTYMASQPWPFPQSIMLGFHAEATSTDIIIDPNELADAAWFTRKQIAEFGNWGDSSYALQLPRPDSIARFLIDAWAKDTLTE